MTFNSTLLMDIGGTNIRMGLLDQTDNPKMPDFIQSMLVRDFPDLIRAIQFYLSDKASVQIDQFSICIAATPFSYSIELTNNDWIVDVQELTQYFKLKRVKVINDFTALSLSVPFLPSADLIKVGGNEVDSEASIALLGPGTGLGVSGLLHADGHWAPLEGEGGHSTMGASNARELQLFDAIRLQYGHVSEERLLSGSGIETVYRTLCEIDDNSPEADLSASDISGRWKTQSCETCVETMELFCSWLGLVAGNLALTIGAQGGVYIGGGIVPKLGDEFINSSFRASFENRGRFSDYLREIPVFIIHAEQPALLGAAIALNNEYDDLGIGYSR